MADTPDPRRLYVPELRGNLNAVTWTIKTRNNPRTVYVRDFQRLSKVREVNIYRDAFQCLDLTTAFKGLTVVTLEDKPDIQSKDKANDIRPFAYNSSSPSPTMTEEGEISKQANPPLPANIVDDRVLIQDNTLGPNTSPVNNK